MIGLNCMLSNLTSAIRKGSKTRVFINLVDIFSQRYLFNQPVIFTGSFEIKANFTYGMEDPAGGDLMRIGELLVRITADKITLFPNVTNSASGTSTSIFNVTNVNNGKLHHIKIIGTEGDKALRVILDEVDYGEKLSGGTSGVKTSTGAYVIGHGGFRYWKGIVADVELTNVTTPSNSLPIIKLDQVASATELVGGVSVDYINLSLSSGEVFRLSSNEMQWDNISPDPQQLPATLLIA